MHTSIRLAKNLCFGIVDVVARGAQTRSRRRHVHDGATLTSALGRHAPHGLTCT